MAHRIDSTLLLKVSEETPHVAWYRRIGRDWLALLLGPAISVPFGASYAALLCQGPGLHPYFPVVLQQVIWTQLVGSVLALFFGQFVTTSNMDPLVAILFARLAKQADSLFSDPEKTHEVFFCNMMFVMPLTTLLLGIALFLVGRLRVASILRFFPYTVVGGFLAGSGVLIMIECLNLSSGVDLWVLVLRAFSQQPESDLTLWMQVILACTYSYLVGYARELNGFGTPLVLVICVSSCYMLKLCVGLPPDSWYLVFPGEVDWKDPFVSVSKGFWSFDPGKALDVPLMASFLLIMTVSWSVNTLAIAKLVPLKPGIRRCDEQAEVQSLGFSNMVLGALGCHASMQSFKIPLMMKEVQAGHLWPYFNLVMNVLIWIKSPRSIVMNVPRFIFSGTVLRLALDLIVDWLVNARNRIATREWCVLALTACVVVIDVSLGVLLGLFLTLVLFAVEYSAVTGVVREGSLKDMRSNVERSDLEHRLLFQYGEYAHIIWLSGYLFFGSVTAVVDRVGSILEDPDVSVVILDFSLVPAMDASGVYAIIELVDERTKANAGIRIVFCGLVRRLKNALQKAGESIGVETSMFHDLDSALEWCEGETFSWLRTQGIHTQTPNSRIMKINSFGAIASEEGGDGINFEYTLGRLLDEELQELDPERMTIRMLKSVAISRVVQSGEVLFRHGERAKEIIVLVVGALDLTLPFDHERERMKFKLPRHHLNADKGDVFVFEEAPPKRVRRARPVSVFGAIEYAGARTLNWGDETGSAFQSTGTAVGKSASHIFALPFHEIKQLERSTPVIALVLRTWLSRLAADALNKPHDFCNARTPSK